MGSVSSVAEAGSETFTCHARTADQSCSAPAQLKPAATCTAYLVVADEAYGREIPFAYLARVQSDFEQKYPMEGQTAAANSLDRVFG